MRPKAVALLLVLICVPALGLLPGAWTLEEAVAVPPKPGASGLNDTCHRCHVGESGTVGGGSLTLDGVPQQFVPRREYTLRVILERGRGPEPYYGFSNGFQLSADGGTFRVSDPGTSLVSDHEVGSNGAVEATEWYVVWVAPETDEDVDFFAEAVVGDADGTEEGDQYVRAWATSYGPLRVPPEDEPRPWDWTYAVVAVVVIALVLAGYALAFTNIKEPPRGLD